MQTIDIQPTHPYFTSSKGGVNPQTTVVATTATIPVEGIKNKKTAKIILIIFIMLLPVFFINATIINKLPTSITIQNR